jgi:lipoprotein-releasing system permease protein
MYRLFLAIRYLLTRPINLLGMAGITISVWALVVVVSLFSGVIDVVEQHVHAASADITIGDLPEWSEWQPLETALRDDPQVLGLAPRVVHYGLLGRPGQRPPPLPLPGRGALHGGDQPFTSVLGIEAAAEMTATGLRGWLSDPVIPAELRVAAVEAPLLPALLPKVLVGLDRMRREGLRPGDRLLLTTARFVTTPSGGKSAAKVELQFEVAGAFKTQHGGFDGNNVFVERRVLAEALFPEQPQFAHEIAVKIRDAEQLLPTAERLQRQVRRLLERDDRGHGIAQTWRERNALFLGSVQHQRGLLKIVLFVILVVAAFLMLATLSMMVTEKVADIGILTAMGGTPLGVTSVFLACGIVITVVGVALGSVLGIVTALYLEEVRQAVRWLTGIDLFPLDVYNLDRVPAAIEPLWLLQVAGMALLVGVLVSVVPALRAARHDPLTSLRNG